MKKLYILLLVFIIGLATIQPSHASYSAPFEIEPLDARYIYNVDQSDPFVGDGDATAFKFNIFRDPVDNTYTTEAIAPLVEEEFIPLNNVDYIHSVTVEGVVLDRYTDYNLIKAPTEGVRIYTNNSTVGDEIIINYVVETEAYNTLLVEQIDRNGNVINLLDTIETFMTYRPSTDLISNGTPYQVTFEDITFNEDHYAFYQIRYGGLTIWKGGVAETPDSYEMTDSNTFRIGKNAYDEEDTITHYRQGDIIPIHYRFSEDTYDELSPSTWRIMVGNAYNNTTLTTIKTDDIYTMQTGVETADYRNQWFPIVVGEEIPPALIYDTYDSPYIDSLTIPFENAPYIFSLTDDSTGAGTYYHRSEHIINISDNMLPIDMYLGTNKIDEGGKAIVHVHYANETYYNFYASSLVYLRDSILLTDYQDSITGVDNRFTYSISDTLTVNDLANFRGYYSPVVSLYGASIGDYDFTDTENYTVIEVGTVGGTIDNVRYSTGFDTVMGGIILGAIILLILNVVIAFVTTELLAYLIVNAMILVLFAFLGLFPEWLFVIIILILVLISLISFRGGNNE